MNGFQLLANIRSSEKHKSMPVILLSARAGEDAGVESLSSGADGASKVETIIRTKQC
jgi:DNA-binding response OmpR family regulator